ncbi:MAG: hypothetical protein E6J12_01625 [Chloroflexi bacterium]|nr:MAG: hypothetical protein E6J12_01625 [Chloroflexota bacterium]
MKVLAALVGLALLTACASPTSPPLTSAGDWPMFRGDLLRDGHPASAALTADQAGHLKLAWTRPLDGAIDGSPVVSGNRVIALSDHGVIAAWDIRSGAPLWSHLGLGSFAGSAAVAGATSRPDAPVGIGVRPASSPRSGRRRRCSGRRWWLASHLSTVTSLSRPAASRRWTSRPDSRDGSSAS